MHFTMEEIPPWRSTQRRTSDMVGEIVRCMNLSREEWLNDKKRESLLINFVYQSNIGEDVGTGTKEETKEVLRLLIESEEKRTETIHDCKGVLETVNTLKALLYIEELNKDMQGTGLITVQQILELHRTLMDGLHPNCGEIRKTTVYVNTRDGETYYYTHPDIVEAKLYGVIDRHNYHMEELRNSKLPLKEKLVYLIKCAAWLLFNFVDTHPFGDGNGRTCRLLAGYTMLVLVPLPVHPYHVEGKSYRQDYIESLVSCRRDSLQEPSLIAALLVDGLYNLMAG